MSTRILVTHKGETGYLRSETGIDLRTRYGVTFDQSQTATYQNRARAERVAEKVAARFERVELEEV
ncbi:hypothetical protein [Microbacterium sp. SA39]|uniref:hypothetical protein n=1 Tax=Microbacterium sp. SA39 TaxID=1263625 RepID=UPI0005FA90C1|nr:hypothetical protein [Microbacterium sp. SA39]KJQ52617.1 hypothetical protein RS85_03510 [Microbacterium sp. SA39]